MRKGKDGKGGKRKVTQKERKNGKCKEMKQSARRGKVKKGQTDSITEKGQIRSVNSMNCLEEWKRR